jgi:hypothetical protein
MHGILADRPDGVKRQERLRDFANQSYSLLDRGNLPSLEA